MTEPFEIADPGGPGAAAGSPAVGATPTTMDDETGEHAVVAHLEAAVAAAREQEMSVSELLGLLFFYAHNVAQDAREAAIGADPQRVTDAPV